MQRLHLVPVLAALLLLPQVSSAQFVPPDQAKVEAQGETYTPPPAPPRRRAEAAPEPARPEPFSLGIGAGWIFPADLRQPTVGSARFLVSEPLTLEASVVLGLGSGSLTTVQPGDDTTDNSAAFLVNLGLDVRYALMMRDSANLVLIGGALFGMNGLETDPEGPDNLTRTTNTRLDLHYGFGVDWYLTRHLGLSADAMNSLVTFDSQSDENPAAEVTVTDSQLNAGLVWNPSVRVMLHFWF